MISSIQITCEKFYQYEANIGGGRGGASEMSERIEFLDTQE